MLNDTTRTFPRTLRAAFGLSPAEAIAIHVYKRPWYEKLAMLLFRWGWALLLGAVLLLSGCIGPDDADTAILIAQDLQEATEQARGGKVRHIKQPEQELHHAD